MTEPKKTQPKKVEPAKTELNLTPDEQALAARIAGGDREWETIKEEDMVDFSLSEDAYKLPNEAAKKQKEKEFAFRWVAATASRIDQVRSLDPPARWWICNSSNTPFLAKYVDPAHGGIQKLDQVLVFKPWWMHERHQAAKMELAQDKDAAGDIKNRDGVKEEWGEWKAGKDQKIGGTDVVMASDE